MHVNSIEMLMNGIENKASDAVSVATVMIFTAFVSNGHNTQQYRVYGKNESILCAELFHESFVLTSSSNKLNEIQAKTDIKSA